MNPEEIKNDEETPVKSKSQQKREAVTKSDEITMSREEFRSLIKQAVADEMSKPKAGPITLAKRVKNHTLRLREVDGKYVIGLKKDRYDRVIFDHAKNEKGEPDMIVTASLLCEDSSIEEKKMFYLLDFLNGSRQVTLPIVKTRKEEIIENQGTTTKKRVDSDGYKTIDTGVEVTVEVLSYDEMYTVSLPDGREYEVEGYIINA